ncbi:hypothetical protein [Streptomyces collinus]
MTSTAATTARIMDRLAAAEATTAEARREEARTARAAERAAARVAAFRPKLAEARKSLRTAERTGKRLAAAARVLAGREAKLADLIEAAREAKADASAARRAARTAARRLDRLAMRAAVTAARTVEEISHRLGETALAPAVETDRTLAAEELPTVEEIETHAARYATLDARAKDLAKAADAEKVWLRALPVGTYGRVIITRTPGRSVLDGTQVALDYTSRGLLAPRKLTRQTFKCDATAILADLAEAAETADEIGIVLAA